MKHGALVIVGITLLFTYIVFRAVWSLEQPLP